MNSISMKYLTAAALLLCTPGAPFGRTAQKDSWIEVSADAEYFRVSMPRQPTEENENAADGQIDASGKRYEASADGAGYVLWALVNKTFDAFQARDPDKYLDDCAELVWGSLLKPGRDKSPLRAGMTYVKELPPNPLAGREYSVTVGDVTGTIHFYIAQERIFVLMAVNDPGGAWERQKFLGSFSVLPGLPIQASNYEDPKSAGSNASPEDGPIFAATELTQRVRVIHKPEPTYTYSAQKFRVTGTVVLRAVFSKNGKVTSVYTVKKLPHGMTQACMRAARAIEFSPAMKDGQPVSQHIELRYDFNLF